MAAGRAKRDALDITLHPFRSLLAEGALDDLHAVLRTILPQWSKRLRVRLDERSRDWIEVHPRRGSLERAVRKMIAPGETYDELVDELGPATYEREVGVVTITGAYAGVLVILDVDDWVFAPAHDGGQHWGNFISLQASRDTVEGVPATRWARLACEEFCRTSDIAHGFVTTDGEYYSKNRVDGWRIVGIAPHRCLPGIYWLNVFGKPYVKLIGRRRLSTTPGAVTSSVGGHVLVRIDEDPRAWKTRAYRTAVARGLDHIGREFFFDKKSRCRKTVAPRFRFESDRIDKALPPPPPVSGELIVDYPRGKVYLRARRET